MIYLSSFKLSDHQVNNPNIYPYNVFCWRLKCITIMVLAFNQLQIYESQKYVFYLNDLAFAI